jgi:hypothetical protein
MTKKTEPKQEPTRDERGEALRADVIARLEAIAADVTAALADGGRLTGAYVELNEVKYLVGNWLAARRGRINTADEIRKATGA